jgi:Tol biopolymer transport system component
MNKKSHYGPSKMVVLTIMVNLLISCSTKPYPNLLYCKNNGVWVMADNGKLNKQLQALAAYPQWAPGTKDLVSFLKSQSGTLSLCTVDNTGQNFKQLTDYSCGENYSWSPDRNWITYESNQNGNWEIYKIKADGSSATRLTFNTLPDHNPVWSPNGGQIAYVSDIGAKRDVIVMDIIGKNAVNVTQVPSGYTALYPQWSPKGDKIAFIGNPAFFNSSGSTRLYIIDPKQPPPNWNEVSNIDNVSSFLFTPSGDNIIFRANGPTGEAIYKQNINQTNQKPEILTSFGLGIGSMAVDEVCLYFAKILSTSSSSPLDGVYSLTWRWKGDPNFKETFLGNGIGNLDY